VLTDQFARLVARDVFVLDPALTALAWSGSGADAAPEPMQSAMRDPQLSRVLVTVKEERRPVRIPALPDWGLGGAAVIAPIGVGTETLGYLVVVSALDVTDANLDLLTVEHAATVYALAFMRERMAAELANRFREEILEALLSGQVADPEQARDWARLLGYDPAKDHRVLLVVPEEIEDEGRAGVEEAQATPGLRHQLLYRLLDAVSLLVPGAVGVVRASELLVVIPERETDRNANPTDALARDLQHHAAQSFPSAVVTIGVGGSCGDATELARSFAQARQAIQIGRLLHRQGGIVDFTELGIYRLLFQTGNRRDLRVYAQEVLGPLIEYDRKHQADFIRTLRTFFEHNGSLQAAARELYVHVNTVAYRMQRIELIAGLDLAAADDRLTAQIALKILDGLEP
jgi:DNA-binding PucR family transcriptional regulator